MKFLTLVMALLCMAFWVAKASPVDPDAGAGAAAAAVVEDTSNLGNDAALDVVSAVQKLGEGNEDNGRDARHLFKKKRKHYVVVKRPKCYKCWKFGK